VQTFEYLTPLTYWLLVILWTAILVLYVREVHRWEHASEAMKVLLWVLAIDAVRTLFESIYFGGWYTARVGLFPQALYEFLVQPQNVFVPKLVNVVAGIIILTLLIRQWLPKLVGESDQQAREINRLEEEIAKREQVELALLQAKDSAEEANKAKSIFLSNMSHELRTPLNAILGFSEVLARDDHATENQLMKLGAIARSGEHLLGKINDVLDLSKIEAGHVDLTPEAFDLEPMINDIVQVYNIRAEEKKLHFHYETEQGLARYVKADLVKVREIMINLLDNAMKYTVEGGVSLLIRTTMIEDSPSIIMLQMEVRDSGLGIPQDQLAAIFDPFTQVREIGSVSTGTGLGLTITKAYVELMKGQITVESKVGEGTLFRVDLSLAVADAADVTMYKEPKPRVIGLVPDQTAWRILVVEDDAENRMLLSSLLVEVGLDIREAVNGLEALSIFEDWQPHFIWMDMRMPVMDGYKATSKIRTMPGGGEVKIAAVTASVFKEQSNKILESGCDDLIHKPFKSQDIFDVMALHLGVRYLYGTIEHDEQRDPLTSLTAEMLDTLSLELRQDLKNAAHDLDIEKTKKVIERMRKHNSEAANGLHKLAGRYRFSRILELLGDKP